MMTIGVSGELAGRNADALEHALSVGRLTLHELASEDERERRLEALSHIEGYMELLREPTVETMLGEPRRYSFKLVFPDGRWAIDEIELAGRPHAGDVVEFDNFGGW